MGDIVIAKVKEEIYYFEHMVEGKERRFKLVESILIKIFKAILKV